MNTVLTAELVRRAFLPGTPARLAIFATNNPMAGGVQVMLRDVETGERTEFHVEGVDLSRSVIDVHDKYKHHIEDFVAQMSANAWRNPNADVASG